MLLLKSYIKRKNCFRPLTKYMHKVIVRTMASVLLLALCICICGEYAAALTSFEQQFLDVNCYFNRFSYSKTYTCIFFILANTSMDASGIWNLIFTNLGTHYNSYCYEFYSQDHNAKRRAVSPSAANMRELVCHFLK